MTHEYFWSRAYIYVSSYEELARLKRSRVKGLAIMYSRANQDQEMRLYVLGSQAILIVLTQLLWNLAIAAAMFPTRLIARILALMLDGGVITCMEGTVTGVARSAREGVWVPGGGIEIPCEYCTVWKRPREVRQMLRNTQKSRKRRREDWNCPMWLFTF